MGLVKGLSTYTQTPYLSTGLSGDYIPFPQIFPMIQNSSLYDIYKNALAQGNYSLTAGNPWGINYTSNSGQRTAESGSKFQYTASSQQIMHNAGQYFHKKGTYTPQRGDIAIWTKKNDPAHGHVGIVTKVEGDNVWITEGNSGNAVKTVKYSLSKLMKDSGSRPFNGFVDAHSWLGSDVALKAAKTAETEQAKGVKETSNNDSVDIARYKRGAHNSAPWCANFTSYCFTDGQNLNALA